MARGDHRLLWFGEHLDRVARVDAHQALAPEIAVSPYKGHALLVPVIELRARPGQILGEDRGHVPAGELPAVSSTVDQRLGARAAS
jgi:hypothetical protein